VKSAPFLITVVVILMILGIIWVYRSDYDRKITPWSLIGKDAAVVLELPNLKFFFDRAAYIPVLQQVFAGHDGFQFLIQAKGRQQGDVLMAFYPIQSNDFGLITLLETDLMLADSGFTAGINHLKKKYLLKNRMYNGIEIAEYWLNDKVVLSYAFIEHIFAMSTSPFLLEGALRLRNEDKIKLFRNSNTPAFQLPTMLADEGNLYINVVNFFKASDLFFKPSESQSMFSWTGSMASDIKISEKHLLMNGFLIDSGSSQSLFSLFKHQQPAVIDLGNIISSRVAVLAQYSISLLNRWFEDQNGFVTQHHVLVQDSLWSALSQLGIARESLRNAIGSQFAVCYLSIPNEGIVNVVELNEKKLQVSVFEEIASKMAFQNQDSLYTEMYKGYSIGLIDYKDFLFQLYYPLAQRSAKSYFFKSGKYLLMSENVVLLKLFIDDMESDNTWGKSVDWNRFFTSTLQEANVNLFFDGRLTGVYLKNKLNPKWRAFVDSTNFLGIEKGSVQLSRLESNYYFNGSFQFGDLNKHIITDRQIVVQRELNNPIISQATLVRSHISKNIEIAVQDSSNAFLLLSKDFNSLWELPIASEIVSGVSQVDYFANGKLQYFFSTKDAVHVIDRLGRYVQGFPVRIGQLNIEYAQVVDYDMSKRYRYLLADSKGDIYLRDKDGGSLDGWNPRSINGRLASAPNHFRILGHDYFVAVQQNGVVHMMNRRGEYVKGFPVASNIKPSGDFFVSIGNSLLSTYLTLVSGDGLKVEIDWSGQITKRDVLLKQTKDSRFQMVKSKMENSSVILRIDAGKIAVLDGDGSMIFEVENQGSLHWQLSYFENRVHERFYCLHDEQQDFSYLYDQRGKPLISQPLESTQIPTLYYDEKEKELIIYTIKGTSLSALKLTN